LRAGLALGTHSRRSRLCRRAPWARSRLGPNSRRSRFKLYADWPLACCCYVSVPLLTVLCRVLCVGWRGGEIFWRGAAKLRARRGFGSYVAVGEAFRLAALRGMAKDSTEQAEVFAERGCCLSSNKGSAKPAFAKPVSTTCVSAAICLASTTQILQAQSTRCVRRLCVSRLGFASNSRTSGNTRVRKPERNLLSFRNPKVVGRLFVT
jgi:hypothetical protein